MTDARVPGFRPSANALRFTNSWPHEPTLRIGLGPFGRFDYGDAADGLCGGMAFTVADLFLAGIAPPASDTPPSADSQRYAAIVRRQVDSLAFGRLPLALYRSMAASPATRSRAVARDEWPRIRADLDAGRLSMLGLVRVSSVNPFDLTRNHQVMAYGYDLHDGVASLNVYEPNYGARDDITIELHLDGGEGIQGLTQSTGEPLLGVVRAPYRPAAPTAWR